ncbi:MAG: DUF2085 domain-containing protein [Blastocatellia bacterium]
MAPTSGSIRESRSLPLAVLTNAKQMKTTAISNAMIVYAALMTLSILWMALILAAPWLMAERHFLASATIYQWFSAVCHQTPERSFYFRGRPMGVCSRCASVYAGFVIGLLLYPFLRDVREDRFPPRWILIGAAIPAVVDFTGGVLGLFANTFLSRALTGILFGAVAAFYVTPGIVSALNDWRAGFAKPKADC